MFKCQDNKFLPLQNDDCLENNCSINIGFFEPLDSSFEWPQESSKKLKLGQ